jgi:EF-hand domain pair
LDEHLQLLASSKETEMQKHVLVLTTIAAILACGTVAASAQTPSTQTNTQQSPVTQPIPGGPTMQRHTQTNDDDVLPFGDEDDQNQIYLIEPGTMSERGGMMGRGWHHGWHRGRAMMPSVMARIIFSLMDADGDGTISLQEWQAAHERIFKAMDTDHDGTVTFEEMQAFMRGRDGQ